MEATQTKVSWVATTSNGEQVAEHKGNYTVIDGERKPWVRLCQNLATNGEHITSLRLWIVDKHGQRTVNLPRLNSRFKANTIPDRYSIEYILEADDVLGATKQDEFIDVGTHYGNVSVHYIQQINDIANSWIEVRSGLEPQMPSPLTQRG